MATTTSVPHICLDKEKRAWTDNTNVKVVEGGYAALKGFSLDNTDNFLGGGFSMAVWEMPRQAFVRFTWVGARLKGRRANRPGDVPRLMPVPSGKAHDGTLGFLANC